MFFVDGKVEKFETLSDQIIDLIAQSHRPNRGIPLLMQLVFEKASGLVASESAASNHMLSEFTNNYA